jgi:hypothetical protein
VDRVTGRSRREIDQQTLIDGGVPRHVMAAATGGDLQAERSRQPHRTDDVGDARSLSSLLQRLPSARSAPNARTSSSG